jgi:hypothetical protein
VFWEGALPPVVNEWLGLEGVIPEVKDAIGQVQNVATLNDKYKASFAQIADAIERTYLSDVVVAPTKPTLRVHASNPSTGRS